jgi:hypothetical protein
MRKASSSIYKTEEPGAQAQGHHLTLLGSGTRPAVTLAPLQAANKIQWDHQTGSLKPMLSEEESAFTDLEKEVNKAGGTLHRASGDSGE